MSPEMLTLVAAVLAYDTPREICDPRSVFVLEILETCEPRSVRSLSLNVRSETRVEKDMVRRGYLFRRVRSTLRLNIMVVRRI
jgi:hypothetical protein